MCDDLIKKIIEKKVTVPVGIEIGILSCRIPVSEKALKELGPNIPHIWSLYKAYLLFIIYDTEI